jgi:hypothetical protein
MASKAESGHAKNIAAFKTIINACEGYGADYNPTADSLKITNLQTQLADAQAAQTDLLKKHAKLSTTIDERIKAFTPLKPITTRIINALIVSDVEPITIDTAKTITRKIFGKRAAKISQPLNPDEEQANNISVSQLSYVNQVANFNALLELLAELPQYNPNEAPIQPNQLQTYRDQLQTQNDAAMQAYNDYANAKIIRNNRLYATKTGIVDTAQAIKAYVKSLYGPGTPQYKLISGIELKYRKI